MALSMFPVERPGREGENQLKVIISCSPQGFVLFLPVLVPRQSGGLSPASSYDQYRSSPEV